VTFTNTATSTVAIPPGTQVATSFQTSTDSPVIYEVNYGQASYDVPAATGTANGTLKLSVTQGITYTQVPVGTSTGLPGQSYQIPQAGVIDGSVSVWTQDNSGNLAQYTEVQFLVDAGASAAVFSTNTDSSGITWVNFGDNLNGLIPAVGLAILVTYRIGAGSAGNCAAGTVGEMITPIDGITVAIQGDGGTFDSSAMAGGADPETNDQIRANAPQVFATQQRAVSLADFEALAANVPGVTACNAVANHSTSVSIYALGPNFLPASTALQTQIVNAIAGNTLAGVSVSVVAPTMVSIDVGSSATPLQVQVLPNYIMASVAQNIESALTALFQPPNVSFGQLITVGMVYQTILAVAGVQWCVVPVITREDVTQTGTTSIQLRSSEIAQPGSYSNIVTQGGI
jgi:predicted phage baseplate assembly protein